jgi:hypothetical protein
MKEKNESNFENHKGFSRRRGTMRNFVVVVIAATVVIVGTLYPKKTKSRFIIFGFSSFFLALQLSYSCCFFFRGGLSVMKGLLTLLSIS